MNPVSLVILAGLGFMVFLWLKSMSPKKRIRALVMIAIVVVSLFMLLMALTGRLHWIAAVFAGLLPFWRNLIPIILRALPFIRQWYQSRPNPHPTSGNCSEVDTLILHLTLDHDSGVMYGTIKSGPFAGRELGELNEKEFINLLSYCRQQDSESARLLEAYLDKRFGDSWREDDPGENTVNKGERMMNRKEAYDILGLCPGCSREDIVNAHRRLMQKYHPDRGGSDYLAAKINQAKDLLLHG
ncbi:DnaJ domain-containing protein [uncultured Neptuniibacter sp.]|uniref:DnaJ domain-containing protein n=1 Tax=uncultured Neptuniibacter sp. TaxID=502143 RepID=UPI00260AABAA|nr:DnaJ domain-containing protein [uncultured Neptuniibacter sp.]